MKRWILGIFACSLLAALAQTPPAASSNAMSGTVHMKSGPDLVGTISRGGKDGLDVHFKSPTGALVTQRVPLANVDRIEINGADKIEADLAKSTADSLPQVLLKWRTQQDMLDVHGSLSGAYGIRSAELLLDTSKSSEAITAGAILEVIIDRDWDPLRRDHARTLVIDSLRRSGKHAETLKAARDFLAADADAESKAAVSYYLGLALEEDYKKFLTENPRWASDPYMRPKRDQLYNEILDCFLASYLRYGAPPATTAKSLIAAVQFLDENGEPDQARFLADDIVKIFATQPEVVDAKKYLEKN